MSARKKFIDFLGTTLGKVFAIAVFVLVATIVGNALWNGQLITIKGPWGLAIETKSASSGIPKVETPKDEPAKPPGQFVANCGVLGTSGNVTGNQVICGSTYRTVTIVRKIASPVSRKLEQIESESPPTGRQPSWENRLVAAERAIQNPDSLSELGEFVAVCQSVTDALRSEPTISSKLDSFDKLSSTIHGAGICSASNACFALYGKSVPFKNVYECVPR